MAQTYRQLVDQWFARNPDHSMSFSFTEDGPEHARRYRCTYLLDSTIARTGEWKTSKRHAKESAAAQTVPALKVWGNMYVALFTSMIN